MNMPTLSFALVALASLTALAVGQSNAYIPSWNGPELHAWLPGGGLPAVKGTKWARIYHAEPEFGTYNHACMIDAFNGSFLAYWKNSPRDEDQPGQRVLWSFSADGQQWTPTDGKNILFPNMSTSGNLVALFAEPALHINGHQYLAASPKQFCLYPTQFPEVLLLRRVLSAEAGSFGPVFWAAQEVPPGFEQASDINGVLTLKSVDDQTRSDIALLQNSSFAPCSGNKCEYCLGGCQDWKSALNVSGLENERTHYNVPGSSADVLLYRNKPKTLRPLANHTLWSSYRTAPDEPWLGPFKTNITDDTSNINAGSLPDGRVFLVSNVMLNLLRDPLYVSISDDGVSFTRSHVVASCVHPHAAFLGLRECVQRYQGGAKEGGPQYPQAIAVGSSLHVIFSVNKEDVWIATLPMDEL